MKRILVLKACGSLDEPHECNGICEQATLYGIERERGDGYLFHKESELKIINL